MKRPEFHFREAQSAYDLIWHMRSVDTLRLEKLGGDILTGVVHHSACRFEREAEEGCYSAVVSAAIDGTEDAALAVAVLVANDLQQGLWHGDAKEFAAFSIEKVLSAPLALRSAILRGLDAAEDLTSHDKPAAYFLPNESRLTQPMEDILPLLCEVARGMDQPTLEGIAAADRGEDVPMHIEALLDVLSNSDCQFTENQSWFPLEVIELVAHRRSSIGFIPCTALLLANALPNNDRMGWFDFRWHKLAADYNALPEKARTPILAGIRYLYEQNPDFSSYTVKTPFDPVLAPEGIIQFG